ncbi:KAP family NTPase [Sphingomonas endolithica]|uniref:KAP family NTPase n=1 Tax=Sphingomonas endolithica TaxID=2972485 RepID=UPI0021AECFDF|nr:KAP family NTPase [Sphingomonas sp. ZFBP2030]
MPTISRAAIAAHHLNFIEDSASDSDSFGAHDRVATAIAGVITAHDRIKMIGLLGPWGSGKSTVVRLLGKRLPEDGPKHTFIFCYDAWLHQSDPPKRSFLERLIAFLDSHKLIEAADWQENIDVLNRRIEDTKTISSPRLTAGGWLVLLSLVLVPAGTRLIGTDWYTLMRKVDSTWYERAAFPAGFSMIIAPAIIMLSVWFAWRPHRNPFSKAFWSRGNWNKYRKERESASLLALFLNKQVSEETKRVIKSPEPTTLEFQDQFRKLIKAASADNRRFVLVIDNLDRLPAKEAIEMWNTIRSFFLGALEEGDALPRTRLPTIILPVDENAISGMFLDMKDSAAAARSFVDKTFDITFYLSPPVSSHWQSYLACQMKAVFGDIYEDEWSFQVSRIYSRTIDSRFAITPRDINKLINAIATLWLQWSDAGIPLVSIAYFVIHRTVIEKDIHAAIANPALDLSDQDAEWARSLAALRFSVPLEDALQVLLGTRLELALAKTDVATLREAAQVKGFEGIIHRLLDDLPNDDGSLPRAVTLLARAELDDAPWLRSAWRKLRRNFLAGDMLEDGGVDAFEMLSTSCPPDRLESFLADVAIAIPTIPQHSLFQAHSRRVRLVSLIEMLWTRAAAAELVRPNVLLPGDATLFLDVTSALWKDDDAEIPLRTIHSPNAIVSAFVEGLSATNPAPHQEARARIVLDGEPPESWTTAIVAADSVLRTTEATSASSEAAALLLGRLSLVEVAAREKLHALGAEGVLQKNVEQLIAAGDYNPAARFVALMLASKTALGTAYGQSWDDFVGANPWFVEAVDNEFTRFSPPSFASHLVNQATNDPSTSGLISPLLTRRALTHDLGRLPVQAIVGDVERYLRLMPDAAGSALLATLPEYTNFWTQFAAAGLSRSALRIYVALLSSTGGASVADRRRAKGKFLGALKDVKREQWRAIIAANEPMLDVAVLAKVPATGKSSQQADLFGALSDLLPDLVSQAERPYALAWTKAATILSSTHRRAVMATFRDQLLALPAVENLAGLLEATGKLLLIEGKLVERADEVVRRMVVPLIETPAGRSWIMQHYDDLKPIFIASNADTQTHFSELLELWATEASAQERDDLAPLLSRWSGTHLNSRY